MALAHAARQLKQSGERRAHRHLVIARQLDVARYRINLGTAVVGLAAFQVSLTAVANDPRHCRKGLGVVDGGGFSVQAKTGGKRWLAVSYTHLTLPTNRE